MTNTMKSTDDLSTHRGYAHVPTAVGRLGRHRAEPDGRERGPKTTPARHAA